MGNDYKKVITVLKLGEDGVTLNPAGELLDVCVGANYLVENRGCLYASDGMGKAIVALRIEPSTGALSLINK